MSQKRHPAGQPTGGQFAPQPRQEPDWALARPAPFGLTDPGDMIGFSHANGDIPAGPIDGIEITRTDGELVIEAYVWAGLSHLEQQTMAGLDPVQDKLTRWFEPQYRPLKTPGDRGFFVARIAPCQYVANIEMPGQRVDSRGSRCQLVLLEPVQKGSDACWR